MSTKDRSIYIIKFLWKCSDWESWSEEFLLQGKRKGCKKLLMRDGSTVGFDKIPMFEKILDGDADLDRKIFKLGELNELAYEDFILTLNTNFSVDKVAFGLVRNAKRLAFPNRKYIISWNRQANKYAPQTTSSLFHLNLEYHSSKLDSAKRNPDE